MLIITKFDGKIPIASVAIHSINIIHILTDNYNCYFETVRTPNI